MRRKVVQRITSLIYPNRFLFGQPLTRGGHFSIAAFIQEIVHMTETTNKFIENLQYDALILSNTPRS